MLFGSHLPVEILRPVKRQKALYIHAGRFKFRVGEVDSSLAYHQIYLTAYCSINVQIEAIVVNFYRCI